MLRDEFSKVGSTSNIVNYEQAKAALMSLLLPHFNFITDEKLKIILRVGEMQGANEGALGNRYDFNRFLNVYKNRHAAPQL